MSFASPSALVALLVLPLVFAVWWLSRHRRRPAVVRVTSIALVRAAVPGRPSWRRRIPPALLALGLAVLAVGAARPQATVPVPSSNATIMLALDVSGSMCSTDVKPNRITAAEQAAADFIKAQTGGPHIGLVAFASTAVVLVPPTTDVRQLTDALGGLSTSFGTAIGEGILTSLDAIAQVDPSVPPTGAAVSRSPGAAYADDVIVVLTDGSNNRGIDPQTAAKQAAGRGIRVFTIGYGTDSPAPLACSSDQFGGFGSGGFGGGSAGGGGGFGDQAAAASAGATPSRPTTTRSCISRRPPAARSTARRTPASSAGRSPICSTPSRSSASTRTSPPGSQPPAACSSPRRWRSRCGGTAPGAGRTPRPPGITDRRSEASDRPRSVQSFINERRRFPPPVPAIRRGGWR